MNYSLFQNIENFKINTDPFPHIIIENALNDELYEKLSKNFPKENDFKVNFTENNKRDDIYIDSTKIKELDKDVIGFINYHGSKKFWEEVVHFFGKHIIKLHNNIFSDLKVLENLSISNNRSLKSNKISLKDIQAFNNRKIFLHSSVSINTPVHKKSNVRGVHLDKLNKLYGGLFYLRHPADNSTGGDLEILKWQDNYPYEKKKELIEKDQPIKKCYSVKKMNYKSNSFIFFINSIDSLHAVSQRDLTNFERRFFYLAGVLNYDLYDLNYKRVKKSILKTLFNKIYK